MVKACLNKIGLRKPSKVKSTKDITFTYSEESHKTLSRLYDDYASSKSNEKHKAAYEEAILKGDGEKASSFLSGVGQSLVLYGCEMAYVSQLADDVSTYIMHALDMQTTQTEIKGDITLLKIPSFKVQLGARKSKKVEVQNGKLTYTSEKGVKLSCSIGEDGILSLGASIEKGISKESSLDAVALRKEFANLAKKSILKTASKAAGKSLMSQQLTYHRLQAKSSKKSILKEYKANKEEAAMIKESSAKGSQSLLIDGESSSDVESRLDAEATKIYQMMQSLTPKLDDGERSYEFSSWIEGVAKVSLSTVASGLVAYKKETVNVGDETKSRTVSRFEGKLFKQSCKLKITSMGSSKVAELDVSFDPKIAAKEALSKKSDEREATADEVKGDIAEFSDSYKETEGDDDASKPSKSKSEVKVFHQQTTANGKTQYFKAFSYKKSSKLKEKDLLEKGKK